MSPSAKTSPRDYRGEVVRLLLGIGDQEPCIGHDHFLIIHIRAANIDNLSTFFRENVDIRIRGRREFGFDGVPERRFVNVRSSGFRDVAQQEIVAPQVNELFVSVQSHGHADDDALEIAHLSNQVGADDFVVRQLHLVGVIRVEFQGVVGVGTHDRRIRINANLRTDGFTRLFDVLDGLDPVSDQQVVVDNASLLLAP